MELNLLQRILLSLVTGITEILPVAERAHAAFLLKIFGARDEKGLFMLFLHLGAFCAMYHYCRPNIQKFMKAKALSRIPKKRRKRPLDVKSLMDYRFLRTMIVPVVLAMLVYTKLRQISFSLLSISFMMFLNGIILYIPQFFPTSNKDSRSLSRLEGLAMGLGGALAVLPGLSGFGTAVSIGSICGVDRNYGFDMAVLLNMLICTGWLVFDVFSVFSGGVAGLSIQMLGQFVLCGCISFLGASGAILLLKSMVSRGLSVFSFYCWGIALLIFILNLMA